MDLEYLRSTANGGGFGIADMLAAAEAHGCAAWQQSCAWDHLAAVPFPALAELHDGSFLVLGAFASDRVLLQDPARRARAIVLRRDQFLARWSGRLVLLGTVGLGPART